MYLPLISFISNFIDFKDIQGHKWREITKTESHYSVKKKKGGGEWGGGEGERGKELLSTYWRKITKTNLTMLHDRSKL